MMTVNFPDSSGPILRKGWSPFIMVQSDWRESFYVGGGSIGPRNILKYEVRCKIMTSMSKSRINGES
jgi:hypothetical protein